MLKDPIKRQLKHESEMFVANFPPFFIYKLVKSKKIKKNKKETEILF
jgi:hypothetical protein